MTSTSKKIVLSGYYGFDNLGDEAILDYLINFLKQNNIEPIVLSANPEKTSITYQVQAVDRSDFTQVLNTLKESDGLISGGGSLLQDKTSKKSLIYYLIIMYMAKKSAKIPVYFYGQGVGPINSKDGRFLTKLVLNKMDLMSVRDIESHELLTKTIKLKNIIDVIHDPVLFYDRQENENITSLFSKVELDHLEKRPVYLSIRPTENNQRIIDAFYGYVEYLAKKDIPVVSFAFHPAQDTKITNDILGKFDNVLFIEEPVNLEKATYIIENSRLVVGMRLHSLILAASQHTPFVGVSYDPKIDSFVKQFGQHVAGDINNITKELLIDETNLILNNEEVSKLVLIEHLAKMKEVNDKFNYKLISVIQNT